MSQQKVRYPINLGQFKKVVIETCFIKNTIKKGLHLFIYILCF